MKRLKFLEEQRSGGQEGFLEVRKLGGQEGKPVNKTSPRPLREREEFVSERSAHKGLIALSPLNNKKLDCFAYARNDKSCAKHTVKNLFAYSPIRLFTFKKSAFTLAEVMIVIAIIGVVATITLTSFIKNYQKKILETQFKKNYAEISKLSNEFLYELGSCNNENFNAMNRLLTTKLNNAKFENRRYSFIWKNYPKTMKPGQMLENCLSSSVNNYTLPNQALIGFCINSNNYISFTIDINGYNKKPNALGHDLFYFTLDENCKFKAPAAGGSNRCFREYTDNLYTGVDCVSYAIQNKCPDDISKTYWECLP